MLTRKEWGARSPMRDGRRTGLQTIPIEARSEFFVHYDGGDPVNLRNLDQVKSHLRAMQAFHMGPDRGWSDIGYNLLVVSAPGTPVDGLICEGRGRDVLAAQCEGHNTAGIGVQVMIGGNQQPSPAALNAVRELYDQACKDAGKALRKMGHCDGYKTDCPGPNLLPWVRKGMPRSNAAPTVDPWTRQERPVDAEWDILDSIQLLLERLGKKSIPPCSNLSVINALRSTFGLATVNDAVYGRDLVTKMQAWAGKLEQNGVLSDAAVLRITDVLNRQIKGEGL